MSEFIQHEGCPRCGSRDNLAVYDDGHKWCFGCRLYIPPTNTPINEIVNRLEGNKEKYNNNSPELPIDFSVGLPKEPMLWLKKYGITLQEVLDNHIGWSNRESMMIFPYFSEGEVIFWQGRYFPARKPKVYSCGYPHKSLLIHKTKEKSKYVVLVEDPVSAVKVSRYVDSMPLFGCNCPQNTLIRLHRYYEGIYIWLDFDKLGEAMKLKNKCTALFKNVKIISTQEDPKECDNIMEILT